MINDWHPLVVHFPIALISTSVVFDYLFYFTNRNDISSASWWTMFSGLFSSLAAIASGIIDDSLIGHLGSVWPFWYNHGAMQIIAIIGFTLLFYFKTSKEELYKKYTIHYLASASILVAILFYGAHLGAQLSGRV